MSEKGELINEWIDKADHDLGSAKVTKKTSRKSCCFA
jgi:hypothetical protein